MSAQQDFINKIAPAAMENWKTKGVLPSLVLSQSILESGWGKSGLAIKAFNLFGVKAPSTWTGMTYDSATQEWDGTKYITIIARWKKFNNWGESITDHANLLSTSSRYKNLIGVKDYRLVCRLIREDGYATAPDYTEKLIKIIEQYNLVQYDTGKYTPPVSTPTISTNSQFKIDDIVKVKTGSKWYNNVGIASFVFNTDMWITSNISSDNTVIISTSKRGPTTGRINVNNLTKK